MHRQDDISIYHVYVDKDSFHIEEIDRIFFWNEADVPPRPTPKPTNESKRSPVDDKHAYHVACPDCGDQLEGTNQDDGPSMRFTRRCMRCSCFMRVTLTREKHGWDAVAEKIVPRFIMKSGD